MSTASEPTDLTTENSPNWKSGDARDTLTLSVTDASSLLPVMARKTVIGGVELSAGDEVLLEEDEFEVLRAIAAGGSIFASVQPRSGLLADLLALDGLPGELSYPTDVRAIVQHTGVAAEATAFYPTAGRNLIVTKADIPDISYVPISAGLKCISFEIDNPIDGVFVGQPTIEQDIMSAPPDDTTGYGETVVIYNNGGAPAGVVVHTVQEGYGDSADVIAHGGFGVYVRSPAGLLRTFLHAG